MTRTPRILALGLGLLIAPVLQAQVVRGSLTERTTQVPLAGVVIEVFGTDGTTRVGSTLSSADGRYAVRLPTAGRYLLTAKRIGVTRARTAPFDVAVGETIVRDLVIDALRYTLPEVVVTGLASCSERPRDVARIASLWEEARTALFATQLSLRDELFRAHVTRYVRELEPRSARILSETRSEVSGVVSRPFTSIDAESLSARGYWQNEPDGSVLYYGPDADVLLSDPFVRDHCFREVTQRDRRGLVGLGFRPVAGRTLPDVLGTLWLDDRTFELRFVEFTYSRAGTVTDARNLGGEVHFARLPSGAWIVRRWYIRLPITARPTSPVTTRQTTAPWVLVRPTGLNLREEGGEVAAEELVRTSTMVALTGILRDSANRPWEGTAVRIAGTRLQARSRATGSFTIDSVPYGTHALIVEDPGYDSLGLTAADARVEVAAGRVPRVTLRALNGRALFGRLCPGRTARRGTGALRVSVRTAEGDSMIARLPVQVTWTPRDKDGRPNGPAGYLDRATDDAGRVTFCDLPAGPEIVVVVARRTGGPERPVIVRVPDRGAHGVIVRLGQP